MGGPSARERLARARGSVRQACVLLANPRTCRAEECLALLGEAHGLLEELRGGVPAGLREPVVRLESEIRHAGNLAGQAARYGRQWLDRLRATEYNASGDRAPLKIRGQISCIG